MEININNQWVDLFDAYTTTKNSLSELYRLENEMIDEIEFLRRSNASLRGHLKREKLKNRAWDNYNRLKKSGAIK